MDKVIGFTLVEDTKTENGWFPGDSVWKVAVVMAKAESAWSEYHFGGYVEELTNNEGFVPRIFQTKHEAQTFINWKENGMPTQGNGMRYKVGDKFIRELNGSVINMEIIDVMARMVRFHYTIEVEGEPFGEYTETYGRLAFNSWLKKGFQRV